MQVIHLNNPQVDFTAKDTYTIKLTRNDLANLSYMLFDCLKMASEQDWQLEPLVMEEIKTILKKKHNVCINTSTIKFLPSQACVLFLWMNQLKFNHPLHNNLAGRIVDQIYRQMI